MGSPVCAVKTVENRSVQRIGFVMLSKQGIKSSGVFFLEETISDLLVSW